jgi:hypothetical protein
MPVVNLSMKFGTTRHIEQTVTSKAVCLNAIGCVIGVPGAVCEIAKAVVASLQLKLRSPPTVPVRLHVQRIPAPPIEVPYDGNLPDLRPKKLELDTTILGYACHCALPFVTIIKQK